MKIMHIRKNIMKIPFWGYYFLQDAWIKKRLKKINCENEDFQNDADHMSYGGEYSNIYTSKVTYNENGVISIMVSYEWYQGGVADYGCDCYTFDLTTGDQLKLTDVCNGSNRTLTKKIKNRLLKKYSKDGFTEDGLQSISADKCDFYLKKNGKAVVVFDKYEISYGAAGAFNVTLNSKY